VLTAYALTFAALVALRAFAGGLFRDLKEIEFVAPLVAVTAGTALEDVARYGATGRGTAALLAAGLAVFSIARYAEYWRTYASLVGLP
jgi:hypothetical protein